MRMSAELLLSIKASTSILEVAQIADAYAVNLIAGKDIVPLPEAKERTYSATEIGKMLGVSANKIGRLAKEHGMKTPENGKLYHDKPRYSNKEVDTFRYYECAIDKFRKLIK